MLEHLLLTQFLCVLSATTSAIVFFRKVNLAHYLLGLWTVRAKKSITSVIVHTSGLAMIAWTHQYIQSTQNRGVRQARTLIRKVSEMCDPQAQLVCSSSSLVSSV